MRIEKPNIYEINGRRYFELDELIDYNLDKYSVLKKHHKRSISKLYEFCQKVSNDEYISEKEEKRGVKALVDVLAFENVMKELKKEFLQLVKAKKKGGKYLMLLDSDATSKK